MNILIVDDDRVSQLSLAQALAPLCRTAPVAHGSAGAAMQALRGGYLADLIVTDVRMPDMSGIELLDVLRQDLRFAPLPVMLITSSPEQTVVRQAMQIGVQGFILKPASPDALVRARVAIDRFRATLIEPPNAACRRMDFSPAQYWQYLAALVQKIQQLIRCLQQLRSNDCDVTDAHRQLRGLIDTCLGASRSFSAAPLARVLASLSRAVKSALPPADDRFDEIMQALALNQHWLQGYIASGSWR